MESMLASQSGRLDRHVRRSYVRMSEGAPRYRIGYWLEESLRLARLPGEDEGWIYCFRRVSLSGIPAEANRRVWVEAAQQALGALASQAVHASDPGSSIRDAVFFYNREEALEMLLRHALRAGRSADTAKPEWYSASVLGVGADMSYEQQIPAIVDLLLNPASMASGAAILFAALDDRDPAALLSAIPAETLREWIRELNGAPSRAGDPPSLVLPVKLKTALRRAAAEFGWNDHGTVWLAAQAVLCVAPGALNSGTVLRQARSALRMLEAEQRSKSIGYVASVNRGESASALVFDDENKNGLGRQLAPDARPGILTKAGEPEPVDPAQNGERDAPSKPKPDLKRTSSEAAHPEIRIDGGAAASPPLLGEVTAAAGLYFLLNALRRVGIAAAVEACPALADADFAAHILRRLALHAGVIDNDPVLHCLPSRENEFFLPREEIAGLLQKTACFPAGFAAIAGLDSDSYLRTWVLAVRRWCWRTGRITVRDIVTRDGRVWLTRADLDVTMPLSVIDIRIRRIGLDIDPGWLPWFGSFGRVVRFHYRDDDQGWPC